MNLGIIATVLLFVPLVDHGIKDTLQRWLGAGRISLGILGSVKLVKSPLWMMRPKFQPSLHTMWQLWFVTSLALVVSSGWIPGSAVFVGLLLGGSFSHALEHTWRGHVRDYVCLRFWPAFNLADAAIAFGSAGLLLGACLRVMKGGAP
jgi:signal peptidase II